MLRYSSVTLEAGSSNGGLAKSVEPTDIEQLRTSGTSWAHGMKHLWMTERKGGREAERKGKRERKM